jgi:hypothetical protein
MHYEDYSVLRATYKTPEFGVGDRSIVVIATELFSIAIATMTRLWGDCDTTLLAATLS